LNVIPINQRALLTRRDAAAYLSVSYTLFRSFEASGDIKGIKIGTGRESRYRRSDLDEFIERLAAGELNIDRTKRR
jgi:excisionase family DNA binding protein